MEYPEGFKELINIMKKDTIPLAKGREIWEKYWKVVLMGKGRSEAEITLLGNMLKKYLEFDYVLKTNGEDWQEEVEKLLKDRLTRVRDESMQTAISELLKGIFYTMASLKGGARFFEKKDLFNSIDKMAKDEESTWEFIEEIVEDKDVTGIKYAKAILWLQLTGRARDFAPPTRQLKSFLNTDMGPYYSYYEDDKYFMERADEMRKDFKADLIDIYRAVYFYRTLKTALPRGSKFTPKKLVLFMKKEKLTPAKLSEGFLDTEKKDALGKKLFKFMGYAI